MVVEAKICGLTRPEDARLAVALGASWLGVVFAGGPRQVDVPRARAIVDAVDGVPVLGVFAGHDATAILDCCDAAGLSGAQLHDGGTEEIALQLASSGLLVWRVARMAGLEDLPLLGDAARGADVVLVEPRLPNVPGGSGTPLDLSLALAARQQVRGPRFALAGGLTAERLPEALSLVQPDIVDVSSGVEHSAGIKSPERMKAFLEVVCGEQAGA
ncbi:MAG TPA: phosphoribosylanthranilate isomerase [Gemmatimonadales bacterium]|nr:phosphoribosylanthranilate isomerase [Gemmatimonadales bacterium]